MTIQLVGDWPQDLATAVEAVYAAAQSDEATELPDGMVNLRLVDDAEITALNTEYTGNAYATDVLTFPYETTDALGESLDEDPTIADVVISVPTAQRQADAAGISLADEVGLLALHGLLHAVGFDHADPETQQIMEQLQQRLMATANLTYRDFQWNQ